VRVDRVVFTRAAESAVLLDPRSGRYYSLTDVGARIWELCDGQRTLDEITREIAAEYEAAPETIRADIVELLQELESEGLLASG
jgi:Coenzyme PQQ synthesis protein D (PqqD)